MQMRMEHSHLLLSLLFTISFFHLCPTPIAVPFRTFQLRANEDFIRRNCNTTLYADVCYSSLSSYARDVQQSLTRLVRVSISVSHSKAKPLTSYVSRLYHAHRGSRDHRFLEALDQCAETLNLALGDMEQSLDQMRKMRSETDTNGIANVQTWMSAALTDAESCIEGFEDVSDEPDKLDVIRRTTEVMDFTSIVLAFIAEISPPLD